MSRIVECASCGGRFEGKRPTAKYCSPRCRTRASRATKGEAVPPRRDAAIVIGLPPKPPSTDGFAAQTRRDLEEAGRLDTYLGRAALYLAQLADVDVGDTLAGHASLMKQYVATMDRAMDGVQAAETPLEKIRRERDLMAG